jgi:hypothetical protein
MSTVAVNPQTGEVLVLGGEGQWQPAQRAVNPQTGQELYSTGTEWLPLPNAQPPIPTAGETLKRSAGLATRALGPIAAGAAAGALAGAPLAGVGAVPGALAGATSAALAGPISDLAVSGYRAARDLFAPDANRAPQPLPSQAVENLMTAAGLPVPQTPGERMMTTGVRAAGEAATGAALARAVAQGLPIASQTARPIAEMLAASPTAQTVASGLSGTATQAGVEAGLSPLAALPLGVAAGSLPFFARPQSLFSSRDGAVRDENIKRLTEAGVPLSPGQMLGNPSAQTFESVMRYLPTSAPTVMRFEDDQLRAWTKAVNRNFGLDSDIATPEVLSNYSRQWGAKADALEQATVLRPDNAFAKEVSDMRSQYKRGLDDSRYKSFDNELKRVEDFIAARSQGAQISGENYRVINGELRFAADSAKRSDDPAVREYGKAMDRLRQSFQGLLERSSTQAPPTGIPQIAGPQVGAPRNLAQEWRDLDREYALFSRVREAMGSATGKDKLNTGFIPPTALAQVQRASLGPDIYSTTSDPFTQLIRAGEAVIPNPIANSGTAQRSFAQNVLTGGRLLSTTGEGRVGALAQGGAALLEPTAAAAIPYFVAKQWYAPAISPELRGILGLQSLYGGTEAR